jgi:cytochrome c5
MNTGLLFATTLFAFMAATSPQGVRAQSTSLSGKEVVDAVCANCHASGVKGAPRIGDQQAWSKRASRSLSSLTANALKGIRQMPSHGGNQSLSDLEIKRAVTYMVNQSGGKWTEPVDKKALPSPRTGEQIVKAQCIKCHEAGKGGAPKIGDRDAWIPRLKDGLDNTVRSAINGHGGMPARGGMANLTDSEMRSAVIYLFRGPGSAN